MEIKKDILDNIKLHSEGVQDILTDPPHWLIRWGNTTILLLLLMILLLSCVINYPEFVPAKLSLTSRNAPEKLEVRADSKIEKIFVEDNQHVKKGQLVLVLQSTADYADVLRLKELIHAVGSGAVEDFPLQQAARLKLGEIQADYNTFAHALTDYQLYLRLQPYSPEYAAANKNISELRNRIRTMQQQKIIEQTKYELADAEFKRYQKLFDKKVISASEFNQQKLQFLQAEQDLENMDMTISQLQQETHSIEQNKSGVTINNEKDKINLDVQVGLLFEQLRKSLNTWERDYALRSSTDGIVSFQQFIRANQFVKSGDILLSVMPTDNNVLIATLTVSSINSGKIKNGQKVLLKLDNFPYQEFGMVEGRVKNMANAPDKDGQYYVYVDLPYGLKTSFKNTLTFDKELKGSAEIVTQDLRLIERVFYQLRKLLCFSS